MIKISFDEVMKKAYKIIYEKVKHILIAIIIIKMEIWIRIDKRRNKSESYKKTHRFFHLCNGLMDRESIVFKLTSNFLSY
jgi:hypothetical protein